MPHPVSCPACGVPMQLPDDSPGRGFQCIRCGVALVTTTGGQLATQPGPVQPANPFAEVPTGFSYPGNYAPGPLARGYFPTPMSREAALAKVQGPGLVLQVAGGLVVLAALASLLILLIPDPPDEGTLLLVVGICVSLGLVTGALLIYGGSQLKALQSYSLVMVSVVLMLVVGLLVCPLLALPGIWPMIVMLESGVKAQFGKPPMAA